MKLIVITLPHFFEGEAELLTALFHAGLEILHLRKPEASATDMERLLRQLPEEYLNRIVTHDHFSLATAWHLKGIHLNGRHPQAPDGYCGHISCSCHSLEEVERRKPECDYVFLSPIYDSISKIGYAAAYSPDTLRQAQIQGIIDERVIALGGISAEHLSEVQSLGFGGAALLGDVWNQPASNFIPHFLKMKNHD
ncbi:MAG: thiamine phosphate synthase [Bacteroides sp.]|nr:thiamine phosphate synthase [Bacteroides sp.]